MDHPRTTDKNLNSNPILLVGFDKFGVKCWCGEDIDASRQSRNVERLSVVNGVELQLSNHSINFDGCVGCYSVQRDFKRCRIGVYADVAWVGIGNTMGVDEIDRKKTKCAICLDVVYEEELFRCTISQIGVRVGSWTKFLWAGFFEIENAVDKASVDSIVVGARPEYPIGIGFVVAVIFGVATQVNRTRNGVHPTSDDESRVIDVFLIRILVVAILDGVPLVCVHLRSYIIEVVGGAASQAGDGIGARSGDFGRLVGDMEYLVFVDGRRVAQHIAHHIEKGGNNIGCHIVVVEVGQVQRVPQLMGKCAKGKVIGVSFKLKVESVDSFAIDGDGISY